MSNVPSRQLLVVVAASMLLLACGKSESPPPVEPPGAPKKNDTKILEKGAELLQDFSPIRGLDVYLDGFHVMKDKPELLMEAHHYCHAKNEDVMQCVIYDANTVDANLIGVEYIVSETLFEGLSVEEKAFWHPHNFEILSGELVGPGLPEAAEKALMRKKINSYGKTWHLWDTGHHGHAAASSLPVGAPLLAWSFNADGELPPGLVEERDRRLHVNTADKRRGRSDLVPLARPQRGVHDLAKNFPGRIVPDFVKAK